MIKENSLTRDDLDAIWKAQHGKHEAIVKNLHDLLAKLAWDFTPDQLDHLFDCFKVSLTFRLEKNCFGNCDQILQPCIYEFCRRVGPHPARNKVINY